MSRFTLSGRAGSGTWGVTSMDDQDGIDQRLSAMKPRVTEPTWEEKGMELFSELKQLYRDRPVNTFCMLMFGAVLIVSIIYGVSYIIPVTDPAYG